MRWEYEPVFYFPDLGVYVGCTVMRPALAGKKRGREGVAVEMLLPRYFERLARRCPSIGWGEAATRTTQPDV